MEHNGKPVVFRRWNPERQEWINVGPLEPVYKELSEDELKNFRNELCRVMGVPSRLLLNDDAPGFIEIRPSQRIQHIRFCDIVRSSFYIAFYKRCVLHYPNQKGRYRSLLIKK